MTLKLVSQCFPKRDEQMRHHSSSEHYPSMHPFSATYPGLGLGGSKVTPTSFSLATSSTILGDPDVFPDQMCVLGSPPGSPPCWKHMQNTSTGRLLADTGAARPINSEKMFTSLRGDISNFTVAGGTVDNLHMYIGLTCKSVWRVHVWEI